MAAPSSSLLLTMPMVKSQPDERPRTRKKEYEYQSDQLYDNRQKNRIGECKGCKVDILTSDVVRELCIKLEKSWRSRVATVAATAGA